MPRLKMFAACEKVILDRTGPASLISIFQRMNVQRTAVELPDKATSPTLWAIFSLWECDREELGREFNQIVRVYAPDKTLFIETELAFTYNSADEFQQRLNIQIAGLPIWVEGFVNAQVWLKGEDDPRASYRFEIRYVAKPPMPSTPERA